MKNRSSFTKYLLQSFFVLLAIGCFHSNGAAQLYINEIMASNREGINDDFFEQDDWLEIYNAGSITNLAGYFMSDDPNLLTKWEIPSTNAGLTTVLPNNHLLFWIDNDIDQGEDHANFRLSGDGETIYLVMPDGVTVIDSVAYPEQASDISYGRSCDGCEDWVFFDNSTPDDENMEIIPEVETLFINEVLTNNSTNIVDLSGEHEAWVEIYNPNPFQVNLARYVLHDPLNNLSYTFPTTNPALTAIGGGEFAVIWMDGENSEGADHAFELNGPGSLELRGNDDSLVDEYAFPEIPQNVSWGRSADGGPNSITFNIPTPRVTNSLVIVQPEVLYINELMTDNVSDTLDSALEYEDWFEIYNPGPNAINVAGYYLTDNPANPDKWQIPLDIPQETTIAAGGYLLFFADENQSEGWNHTNFRLSNNGESLSLYSPDGFTLADYIGFGVVGEDLSFGRETDGSPNWVTFLETTPEYSNNGASINVEKLAFEKVNVYPNPIRSGAALQLSEFCDVRLTDMGGRVLLQEENVRQLTCPQLAPGVYLLQINQQYTVRLLIN